MTCQHCKGEWCWLCGRAYEPNHYDLDNMSGCPGSQFASMNIHSAGFLWWLVGSLLDLPIFVIQFFAIFVEAIICSSENVLIIGPVLYGLVLGFLIVCNIVAYVKYLIPRYGYSIYLESHRNRLRALSEWERYYEHDAKCHLCEKRVVCKYACESTYCTFRVCEVCFQTSLDKKEERSTSSDIAFFDENSSDDLSIREATAKANWKKYKSSLCNCLLNETEQYLGLAFFVGKEQKHLEHSNDWKKSRPTEIRPRWFWLDCVLDDDYYDHYNHLHNVLFSFSAVQCELMWIETTSRIWVFLKILLEVPLVVLFTPVTALPVIIKEGLHSLFIFFNYFWMLPWDASRDEEAGEQALVAEQYLEMVCTYLFFLSAR